MVRTTAITARILIEKRITNTACSCSELLAPEQDHFEHRVDELKARKV